MIFHDLSLKMHIFCHFWRKQPYPFNLIHSPAFSGEKRSQKDGCLKIHKEVGPPLGSNRLPRRMMPSTTAVSILVTVKSHWGATPLRDGNGRCPVFWVGVGHLHVIDVFFQIQTQTFGWITWQLSFSPCSKRRYIFIYHSWLHFPVRFFPQRAQKLWGESPIRSHHPEVPRWGLALPESLANGPYEHRIPGIRGNPWRLESSASIFEVPKNIFTKWWGMTMILWSKIL